MNVYVAGKLGDRSSAAVLIALLQAHGHTITFDWTQATSSKLRGEWQTLAEEERQGVWNADVLIVNNVDEGGLGCWIEAGLALSHSIPVWLFGDCRESIFWRLPEVKRIPDVQTLLADLAEMDHAARLELGRQFVRDWREENPSLN